MAKSSEPFRWFDSSPEVIRLVVMMYVRYPLSLRNVEDLLFERGMDICHEGVVRPNSCRANQASVSRFHDQGAQPVSLVRLVAGGDPVGGDDVRPLPAVAAQRFRRMKTLQKFSAVHGTVHNLFNQERHLISRDLYRERRSAALAEWRAVMS